MDSKTYEGKANLLAHQGHIIHQEHESGLGDRKNKNPVGITRDPNQGFGRKEDSSSGASSQQTR